MKNYRDILHEYWGYDSFRGIQEDIINSIGAGHDTLGLMPTGGGKSITFQVPALAQEGLCLVVTPLIALMKDQVDNLRSRGIKAAAIYSGMSRTDIINTLENCIFGNYKFLYLSPERLGTEIFQAKLKRIPVSFITVDEAHCISQWGYDFRPAYLQIADIRQMLPGKPVLALTATATPRVATDIQHKLLFPQERVFRMSFERPNLAYIVRPVPDKEESMFHILHKTTGSAIIYARNRTRTRELASLLQENGVTAEYYHAGLNPDEKNEHQQRWQSNASRVMVATNAFGMGIDKPDVRLVIHIDMPDSPEAYFQEAGRAGRDGLKAYAVLLYNPHDRALAKRHIADTFPEKDYIRKVYEDLSYYYQMAVGDGVNCSYEFYLEEFCQRFRHKRAWVNSALHILSRCGYIDYNEELETSSKLIFTAQKSDLYRCNFPEPELEQLLQLVLRQYGGVFTDYIPIDEGTLARRLGRTRQQVYQDLLTLNRRHILHYVPGKRSPYITYTQRRVDTRHIVIPHEVYEARKQQYVERIRAMLDYATSTSRCRSQMLLDYFGETTTHQCQRCDVCQQRHASGLKQGEFENIRRDIFGLLADGQPHPADILLQVSDRTEKFRQALAHLVREEEILIVDGFLQLPQKNLPVADAGTTN